MSYRSTPYRFAAIFLRDCMVLAGYLSTNGELFPYDLAQQRTRYLQVCDVLIILRTSQHYTY
jgi:hypothetical protein